MTEVNITMFSRDGFAQVSLYNLLLRVKGLLSWAYLRIFLGELITLYHSYRYFKGGQTRGVMF